MVEAPAVTAVHEQYGDRVTFVGVAGRDDAAAMDPFIEEHGLGGFDHVFDEDLELWVAFGVNTQPAFVFIDADGNADVVIGTMGPAGITDGLEAMLRR